MKCSKQLNWRKYLGIDMLWQMTMPHSDSIIKGGQGIKHNHKIVDL